MPLAVSVVTPQRAVFEAEASFVIARSADGDIGVLPGHAPFLGALEDARLIVQDSAGQTYIAVHGGFIEVLDNRVTVLTQTAELATEIDITRAQSERSDAERALSDDDSPANRARVLKAATRVKTAAEAGLLDIG